MTGAPGTVSKILWHFTGGPSWDNAQKCQKEQPKPANAAFRALCAILESKTLRVGSYAEIVKIVIPKLRRFDEACRQIVVETDVQRIVESVPVACLADIPIMHLGYHAQRYGKIAIGFHRDAAIRHGFNPVLYTLQHSRVIRSIYEGFGEMQFFDTDPIREALMELEAATMLSELPHADQTMRAIDRAISAINLEVVGLVTAAEATLNSLRRLLAFSKTFGENEFGSIYCEREWRSTKNFAFALDDVAMVVVPRNSEGESYYAEFVGTRAESLHLPRSIAVVAWEDLLEY